MIAGLDDQSEDKGHVTGGLFGGNFLFTRDRTASGSYDDVAMQLGLTSCRYPGGTIAEQYFDLRNPDRESAVDPETGKVISLTGLSQFLGFCHDAGIAATIVIPTRNALSDGALGARDVTPEAQATVAAFVTEIVLGNYGDANIFSFEIGNEYFGSGMMTATEYGKVASAFSLAIQSALDACRDTMGLGQDWAEPKIAVQMGMYGVYSTMPGDIQNAAIMAQFDNVEASAVDAVVGHFYPVNFDSISGSGWFFDRLDDWTEDTRFASVDTHITEWNSDLNSGQVSGLRHAQVLLQIFCELVSRGVDSASIWGVQQNTNNDLSGDEGQTTLTIGGEMFRLLRESVVDHVLVDRNLETSVDSYVFKAARDTVVFLGNDSASATQLSVDLSYFSAGIRSSELVVLTTNGDATMPGAQPVLIEKSIGNIDDGVLHLTLQPFEVARVIFSYGASGAPAEPVSVSGGNRSADLISGSPGNDALFGYAGNDRISAGSGDDRIDGGDGADTILGGPGGDLILGGTGNDLVVGGAGADLVYLGGGADVYRDDTQTGAAGADTVWGGLGADKIIGVAGPNEFHGGEGSDLLTGGTVNDLLYGDGGCDTILGGAGDDRIWGGDWDDKLSGGAGKDRLVGGWGKDTLNGDAGNDYLAGGTGADLLMGGDGADTLIGGSGNDTIYGGPGADIFVFREAYGADVIGDFSVLQGDRLDLRSFGLAVSSEDFLVQYVNEWGGAVHISLQHGDSIMLAGANLAAMGDGWFLIA